MGVCQQSRQLYARDDDVDFSDDVYDQDTGDGNTRRPSLGISVGLSQSVVLVTSEIKLISESLSRVSTRNEGLHSAQYLQWYNDTGAKVGSTRCCSRAPLKCHLQLSVWAGIALTQGCVGAVPPLLSMDSLHGVVSCASSHHLHKWGGIFTLAAFWEPC